MKISSPFLNKMSGKLGDSVGAKWNGIKYLREYVEPKNPRTQKQQEQRVRFALVRKWLKPINAYLKEGWRLGCEHMTTSNAAMSYTLKNAVTGNYPLYSIDCAKVLVARGGLSMLKSANVTAGTSGLAFTWTDNSGRGDAKSGDIVFPLVYNEDKSEMADMMTATRADGTMTVKPPTDWAGDTVKVWIAVKNEDGSSISDSEYLGEYTAM